VRLSHGARATLRHAECVQLPLQLFMTGSGSNALIDMDVTDLMKPASGGSYAVLPRALTDVCSVYARYSGTFD
jgi:hypothetical protein